nr:uncharacterized protein LOC105484019 isoform X1 [Macaca nemestrina]XP_011743466.1 uncharacterized protein LOC105484019 isoform X1 [Macaca nemestrina]
MVGWMMWNWMVSILATGAAMGLYDGSPMVSMPNMLWDLVDRIGILVTRVKWLSALEEKAMKPVRQEQRPPGLHLGYGSAGDRPPGHPRLRKAGRPCKYAHPLPSAWIHPKGTVYWAASTHSPLSVSEAVMLCKVTVNTESARMEPLLLGEVGWYTHTSHIDYSLKSKTTHLGRFYFFIL